MIEVSRRSFVRQRASLLALSPLLNRPAPLSKLGIASTSFMGAQIAATNAPRRPARDSLEFLEKCHALGAGGVQTGLNGDLMKLRKRADELGMYIEGMVSIPRSGDMSALEKGLADSQSIGVTVARAAMLSGRRYESFKSLKEWKAWVDQSHNALRLALPVIEKYKVIVALENHKDWTLGGFC